MKPGKSRNNKISIVEISGDEAMKILEASKQRAPYTEEEKAEAFYREHA